MPEHRVFPFGLECAHCQKWHDLRYAIVHVKLLHHDCASCQAEIMLSEQLLDEAEQALSAVIDQRRAPDRRRAVYSEG